MSVAVADRDVAVQARVVGALALRALLIQTRRAQFLLPTFVLPLILLAVVASGTSAARHLPGFPTTGSYVGFVIAGTLVQGTLLLGLTAGISLAADIEGGFFDRLLTAPVQRASLVLGRLAGTATLAVPQATFFLTIAFIFGARYEGGVGGILLTIAIASLTAAGLGGVAAAIALRTGSLSLLQNLFPLVFMLLFTAPAFFPRALLAPAMHAVSPFNPLTYVVEGMRGALHGSSALGSPWLGLASAAGLALASTTLAVLAMRARLRSL